MTNPSAQTAGLRWLVLSAAVLVLIQAGIGMVVDLYVTIPAHHPGARLSNYFAGSFHSVGWAPAHGAVALAIHASLGLALAVCPYPVTPSADARAVADAGQAIAPSWSLRWGGTKKAAG